MIKKDRLNSILDLIEKFEIGTQEELTLKLNEMGFNVSQATVSRDINTLNLIKVEGKERRTKYVASSKLKTTSPVIVEHFKQITTSIDFANNLIVIKTLSGNASAAGNVIDEMNISGIMGTVAGDDTLLIIARTNIDAEKIVKTLRTL